MLYNYGVCNVSIAPLRSEAKHIAEQISQVLFGEKVKILSDNNQGWIYVTCEWDEYHGWIKKSQLTLISKKDYLKRLHFFSTAIHDKMISAEACFLISPGSSLYQLKNNKLHWLHKDEIYHFKGKKINLAKIHPDIDT